MKKKTVLILLAILLTLLLIACEQSTNKSEVLISIGQSNKFTEEEIKEAAELVRDSFSFPASTLKEITYDQSRCEELTEVYLKHGRGSVNGVEAENVIIFLSTFDVDSSGDNPVLNPGTTYENFQWILIRDNSTSNWTIDDCGY